MVIFQYFLGVVFVIGPLYLIFETDYSAAKDCNSPSYKETFFWFIFTNMFIQFGIILYIIFFVVLSKIESEDHVLGLVIFSTMMVVLWSMYLGSNITIFKFTKTIPKHKKSFFDLS